jgi:serine/threonine-protein kinase
MIKVGSQVDDRYRLVSLLGEGGMGAVYEALDLITKRRVAIKFLKPEVAKNKENLARFEREARAMATLSNQNIVSILNVGTTDEYHYMVTELVTGKTLDQELETRARFTYLEAIDILDQLCSAVKLAHSRNVIHRDIKPSNVYIGHDGIVKLGDFGIAEFSHTSPKKVSQESSILGSAHYLAPEICQGEKATFQSDIYALGITLYQLVTGRLPFDGETVVDVAIKQIKEPLPSPRKYISTFPKALEMVIRKAVKKRPKDRYKTVEEFQKALHQLKANSHLLKPRESIWVRWFGFANE